MSKNNVLYQLKILSGISAGAHLNLKLGNFVIGRSQDCELILHDDYITEKHIKLKVSAESLTLKALAQPVYIDEEDIGLEEVTLQACQIIQLGGIHLRLEKAQQPCEQVVKKEPQTAPAVHYKKLYFGIGLLIFVCANLFNFMYKNDTLNQVLERPLNEKIRKIAKSSGIEEFKLSQEKNGHVLVTGYTASTVQKNLFNEEVQKLEGDVKTRIWTNASILRKLHSISNAFGETHIDFSSHAHGEIAASGYASQQNNWIELKRTLLADVTGIKTLDDQNLKMLPDQLKILEQQLSQENFHERLEIKLDNERILVSGELSSEELKRWQTIRDRFSEIYPGALTFVEDLKDTREQIKLSIRSVSIGDVPFIVAKDGRKYQEGSHLGDDYYVKSINEHKIVLEHNNIEIPIDYGLQKEGQQL